jgi:3-isopropylmalate/(R)-2-methylmalate dehydratase small subunit
MKDILTGRVWKFGDDVNTDVIFPGKYTYTVTDPKEIASHAMEDANPRFASEVKAGDIVVGGSNFGCGSSREQAASCLVYAGVGAVVARSFARLYFRNAVNLGLPIVVCPEAVDVAREGDEMTIRLAEGKIAVRGKEFSFKPLPDFMMEILSDGGLIPHVKKKLARRLRSAPR